MLPVRYINLDRDVKRRVALERALSETGMDFDRFPGVLWTGLSPGEQRALYSEALNARQFHKPLVNGEKGCYASHVQLWRWLQASGHAGVIVLEDDILPAEGFREVCLAMAGLPSGWDMVKLIGRDGLGKAEKLRTRRPLCPGFEIVDYRRVPSLTAGYAISREGAQKLLANRVPFGRPIDVDLRHWWECDRLRIQGVKPAAIALADTSMESSIGQKADEAALQVKWRKFAGKLRYSALNAWHGRGLR